MPSPPAAVRPIVIVGGGLAGLAAAVALAPLAPGLGATVTLLESRPRLGGRAGSFTDAATGQMLDACQHVSMGCCTNLAHFAETVGVGHLFEDQPTLYFQTPDRRVSRFKADPWPAPFHLGRALASAHYLTPGEKLRIGYGLMALWMADPDADPPLEAWLLARRQTRRTIDRFWGVVLTSALNETVARVGLRYARKVFVDGFLTHRDGFVVAVPRVPLGRLYGDELRAWLAGHGVAVRLNCGVKRVEAGAIRLRDGTSLPADATVLAVPFDRVAGLLPDDAARGLPYFAGAGKLAASPITSVHLWYDRPILTLPHVVLVDCLGQWVFNRGMAPDGGGGYYVQVVVSAARDLRAWGHDAIQAAIVAELAGLYPAARSATLLRGRVVTEHAATFSAVPGVDDHRPGPVSPLPGVFVAGDWTATGWPATMEGAVRSGYRAAEAVCAAWGRPAELVRAGLVREPLFRG